MIAKNQRRIIKISSLKLENFTKLNRTLLKKKWMNLMI